MLFVNAGEVGIEPTYGGFKGPCLTTWLLPNNLHNTSVVELLPKSFLVFSDHATTKHIKSLANERIIAFCVIFRCFGIIELDDQGRLSS